MKRITLLFLTILVMTAISAFTFLSHDGKPFYTGSPYDSNLICSGCHTGGATVPSVTIMANPAFGAGNTYVSGTTYTISVACSGSYPKYGFGLEILDSDTKTAADAGTFGTVVTTNCKKITTAGKATNMVHTAPSGTSNAAVFSFRWTAPSNGIPCFIYCAINGVNNDGSSLGDEANSTSLALTPFGMAVIPYEQNVFNVTVFPNPATDYATINYNLKENASLEIELYDIYQRKISTLLNKNQRSGEHQLAIDAAAINLKSGIYFIVMKADGKASIQKLIVN